MQHARKNRTLNRTRSQRTALLRGLVAALFNEGKIKTTTAKAKELRPLAEKLITTAKDDTVATRRLVASKLGASSETTLKKLFGEIAPQYKERSGGYTRIIKMGQTPAGRDESVIELV